MHQDCLPLHTIEISKAKSYPPQSQRFKTRLPRKRTWECSTSTVKECKYKKLSSNKQTNKPTSCFL